MEAARTGDFEATLDQVGRYLGRFGQESDPDALFEYANARSRIPLPNNKHIQQSIALLRVVVEQKPQFVAAQSRLLELYLDAGFGQESLTLADRILSERPEDKAAIRAKAITLTRLQRFDEALDSVGHLATVDPHDIQNHLLALSLLERTNKPKEALLDYAKEQRERWPDDARMSVVQSVAYEMVGDRTQAIVWAKRASEASAAEAALVGVVERLLDRLGLYEESLHLLEKSVSATMEPALRRSLVRRQYEAGDMDSVIETSAQNALEQEDAGVLAIRVMACAQLSMDEACESVLSELERRNSDPDAAMWASLLRAVFLPSKAAPQEVIAICSSALTRDNENPQIHHIMALAYERLGESAQAIGEWEITIRLAPAWTEPIMRVAGALSNMGRQSEAVRFALEGINRAPRNFRIAAAAAAIIGKDLDGLVPANEAQLLALVTKIQTGSPLEPTTLPLYVELLCRAGREDEARKICDGALNGIEGLSDTSVIQLADVSNRNGLGYGEQIFASRAKSGPETPLLVLSQALALLDNGKPKEGLALLDQNRSSDGDAVAWKMARAQYLESMDSEDALGAWAEVADEAFDNSTVQSRVLASTAAWQDLALIERVTERIRDATGEGGLAWREARARWLLLSDSSEKSAAEASVLLTDVVHSALPRAKNYVLLATAMERLNNNRGAEENLRQALALEPSSNSIKIELARLANLRGGQTEASAYIEDAIASPNLSVAERQLLAGLLAAQNDSARAIDLLSSISGDTAASSSSEILLAEVYRRAGRLSEAEAVCREMIAQEPTAVSVSLLADLLAAQGREAESAIALRQLDSLDLKDGVRDFILAEHERTYGQPEQAMELYRASLAKAPSKAAVWRRYLTLVTATNQLSIAADEIEHAHSACPSEASFSELAAHGALVRQVGEHPMSPSFLAYAIDNPSRIADAMAALDVLKTYPISDPDSLLFQLKQLAEQYPQFMPLDVQVVRLYGVLGRSEDAADRATQALSSFPGAEEPARLAAEANASANRWQEALASAVEWRRCTSNRVAAADSLIAEAQLRLHRPDEALATLQPYLPGPEVSSAAFSPFEAQYARALIDLGKIEEAQRLLEPRLAESPEWRMAWIRIAGNSLPESEQAAGWLRKVSSRIPSESVDELSVLAATWLEVGERNDIDEYRDRAVEIYTELADRRDASAATILHLAMAADRIHDFDTAQENYRLALERDPELAVARNNLAMLLVTRKGDIDEALRLANQAVESNPRNASFHDTLAQVYLEKGDLDGAIMNWEKAHELEPSVTRWIERREALEEQKRGTATGVTPVL